MKRIAIILPGVFPVPSLEGGAVEKLVNQFIDLNERYRNFNIEVYSPIHKSIYFSKYNLTNFHFINIYSFSFKVLRAFLYFANKLTNHKFPNAFLFLLKKRIQLNDYDSVILENCPNFALFLKSNNLVLHLHNNYLNRPIKNNFRILSKFKSIIVVSQFIKNQLAWYPTQSKISVLKNCVDITQFESKDENSLVQLSNKFRKKKGTKLILFVGRLTEEKGFYSLLKAFNQLSNPNYILLVAGGHFYSSKLTVKEKLKLKTFTNDRIILLGYISNLELHNYYSIVDLVVIPSIADEGAPLVAIEASVSSKFTIASDSGGLPEYVFNDHIIIQRNRNFVFELYNAINTFLSGDTLNFNPKNDIFKETFDLDFYYNNLTRLLGI